MAASLVQKYLMLQSEERKYIGHVYQIWYTFQKPNLWQLWILAIKTYAYKCSQCPSFVFYFIRQYGKAGRKLNFWNQTYMYNCLLVLCNLQ